MAQQVAAWIYGQDGNDWGETGGIYLGFPTQEIVLIPLKPTVTLSGATMNTKIKVIGNSNSFIESPEFYTDSSVTTLVTNSNT